jgi:hypothetical protein
VGGVAFLGIVAGLIAWYLIRKRRSNIGSTVATSSQELSQGFSPFPPPQMKVYVSFYRVVADREAGLT